MLNKNKNTKTESRQRQPLPVEQNKRFSYRASRAPNIDSGTTRLRPEFSANESAPKKHKFSWFSLKTLPSLIAIAAIFGCLIYNMALSNQSRVIITGDDSKNLLLKDTSVYQSEIAKINGSSYWNKTKITYNSASVSKQIYDKFPELKTVKITMPLIGKKPLVKLSSAQPTMILETSIGNFALDSQGQAVSSSTDWANTDTLRVRDDSVKNVKMGQQVIPLTNIQFINELKHQLSAKDIAITDISLPVASESLLIKVSGKPYTVKFTFHGDVLQQSGAFLVTYDQLNKTNTNPAEYVDVRVGERVFVK